MSWESRALGALADVMHARRLSCGHSDTRDEVHKAMHLVYTAERLQRYTDTLLYLVQHPEILPVISYANLAACGYESVGYADAALIELLRLAAIQLLYEGV